MRNCSKNFLENPELSRSVTLLVNILLTVYQYFSMYELTVDGINAILQNMKWVPVEDSNRNDEFELRCSNWCAFL